MTTETNIGYDKIVVNQFGDLDALELQHDTTSHPMPGNSLVKVAAIGVGYTDVMARRGEYIYQRKVPFTPGYEFAGVVTEGGAMAAGTRVAGCLTKMGTYSEYLSVEDGLLVPMPDAVSFEAAAALSLDYMTALGMLERSVQLRTGDKVLIHGAAGGVGRALCQLGKQMELTMYGTASEGSFEQLRADGVEPIDYKSQDFVQVMAEKEPAGIRAVFDHIGGSNLAKGRRTLAPGGTLVSYAFMGRPGHILLDTISGAVRNQLLNVLPGKRACLFSLPKLIREDPQWYRQGLARLFDYVASGDIQPNIGQSFSLHEVARAHQLLESRKVAGKIILSTEG